MSEFLHLCGNERYVACDDAARTLRPKTRIVTVAAMTFRIIMILLYGAGGVPGRGEIPMSSVSSRTPVDFLLRIWGMRSS